MKWLGEIREGCGISWDAIRANKLRAGLATLGIIIGIVTVTLMGAAIQGLNRAFLKSISALGGDVFYIQRDSWINETEDGWLATQKRRPIRVAEAEAFAGQLTLAAAVAPTVEATVTVQHQNRGASGVTVIGTTEEYLLTSGASISQGRFLSAADAAGGRPVCVIGEQVATNLFLNESPLGRKIKINSQSFEVIGVLEKQGNFLGMFSLDNRAVIPLKQFASIFGRYTAVTIQVKAREMVQLDDARDELIQAMRRVRRLAPKEPDDFAVNQQDQLINMFHRQAGTIAAIGLCVTGLALFVGGIGIMNIMFVSVTERTREIGIRKAIGAKRRTILLQFLTEAAAICLLGGTVGLGIATGLTFAVDRFLPSVMSPRLVGVALLVSLVTGVAAGFLPAWRAARLDPVEALRSE